MCSASSLDEVMQVFNFRGRGFCLRGERAGFPEGRPAGAESGRPGGGHEAPFVGDVEERLCSLDKIGYSGKTLSNEKRVLLQNSLLILQNDNHFQHVYFWGHIYGIKTDYFVAYGYEKDILKGRVFYYSTNCIEWGLLPKAEPDAKQLSLIVSTQFQGDPALTIAVDMEGYDLSIQDSLVHMPEIKLKEEDRLASVVSLINDEAAVVPRGALFKGTDGIIVENLAFTGLSMLEAKQKCSYLHYRIPQQRWNTNLLIRPDYNFALDFLDTIDIDIPEGCWSHQFEMGGRLSILRSLYWPGMTFYHCVGTPEHGFMYTGNGRWNIDLPFML
ncbi:radial spoke head protein 9 homolog [Anabrus simplex]|uniref:radial spoke head protein 9 homolog n=1 Tax=Anabrus simplex TaxID=316456 RepID=UPI0035A3A35D